MSDKCWLPELELYNDFDDWQKYQDILYDIFKNDFILSHPQFEGKNVNIRKHPIEYGKEEAFFHVTCQDYCKEGERNPDMRRCERIRWVRAFIENYNSCESIQCEETCDGIKKWTRLYKNRERIHILLEEERYMVVIELRESYCLLITAFYIEHDHTLDKKLEEYEKYREK